MYYIISTIILSYSLYIYHKYTEINVHTEKKDILLDEFEKIDLDNITPIEALNTLHLLKNKIKK